MVEEEGFAVECCGGLGKLCWIAKHAVGFVGVETQLAIAGNFAAVIRIDRGLRNVRFGDVQVPVAVERPYRRTIKRDPRL
jgi:hypothetical protein